MEWHLGKYIEQVLDQKGGRKAGWHQHRLAEKSKLSDTYIGWVIRGESSGKKGPPSISVDVLIALAKALEIPESKLIEAYKGRNPDTEAENSSLVVQEIINVLLRTVPHRLFAEAMINHDGVEKVRELLKEAMERHKNK